MSSSYHHHHLLLRQWQHTYKTALMLRDLSMLTIFTATCFSNVAVMGSLDVRLSVRLSVCLFVCNVGDS